MDVNPDSYGGIVDTTLKGVPLPTFVYGVETRDQAILAFFKTAAAVVMKSTRKISTAFTIAASLSISGTISNYAFENTISDLWDIQYPMAYGIITTFAFAGAAIVSNKISRAASSDLAELSIPKKEVFRAKYEVSAPVRWTLNIGAYVLRKIARYGYLGYDE